MCKAQKYVSRDVLFLSILGCIYVPQHEFDLLRFNYAWTMGKIILLRANGAMNNNYGFWNLALS
jgi:hypothetical protein